MKDRVEKFIWRVVVEHSRYRVYANYSGSHYQIEKLSCGHSIANKGSVGPAERRRCKDCEGLRDGGTSTTDNVRTVWNPDTQMPVKVPASEIH